MKRIVGAQPGRRPDVVALAAPLLRLRLLRLIGVTAFTTALMTVVSDRHRSMFHRWSYPAFDTIVGAVLLSCVAARSSWRAYRAPHARTHATLSPAMLLDVATACWGAGYLLGALDVPGSAGNIFNLNVFGSTTGATIVLYWLCLAALFLALAIWLGSRVTARWANFGLSLATVAFLALLGEGAVRAKALLAPMTQGFPTYSSALWGRRYVRLNRNGFRDSEHPVARVPYTNRVLLIGDSYAFGAGIRRTLDRLGEQLAMRLDSATATPWEVINASHPNLNTRDEIAILDSTLPYRPDVVILVYVFNDIDYLVPVTERTVLTEAPRTMLRRIHPVRLLFKNSFLFQEAYVWIRKIRWSLHEPAPGTDAYADSGVVLQHLSDVRRFVATANGAGSVVGIVPFDPLVAGSPMARRRYTAFVSRALAAGLPMWPVDSVFRGFAVAQLTLNRLDGHPNELANRLVANEIWPMILKSLGSGRRLLRGCNRGAPSNPCNGVSQ